MTKEQKAGQSRAVDMQLTTVILTDAEKNFYFTRALTDKQVVARLQDLLNLPAKRRQTINKVFVDSRFSSKTQELLLQTSKKEISIVYKDFGYPIELDRLPDYPDIRIISFSDLPQECLIMSYSFSSAENKLYAAPRPLMSIEQLRSTVPSSSSSSMVSSNQIPAPATRNADTPQQSETGIRPIKARRRHPAPTRDSLASDVLSFSSTSSKSTAIYSGESSTSVVSSSTTSNIVSAMIMGLPIKPAGLQLPSFITESVSHSGSSSAPVISSSVAGTGSVRMNRVPARSTSNSSVSNLSLPVVPSFVAVTNRVRLMSNPARGQSNASSSSSSSSVTPAVTRGTPRRNTRLSANAASPDAQDIASISEGIHRMDMGGYSNSRK